MKTQKMVYLSFLVAAGIALHIIESFMPLTFIVPGAKLGLANIVTLLAISVYGLGDGLKVSLMRTILGSLLSGTFLTVSFYLGFSGALLSTLVMGSMVYLSGRVFSLIGISIMGAISHNLGQLTAAYILIEHSGIFFYLPYLLLFALPTGFFVGLVVIFTQKYFYIHGSLKDIGEPLTK